MYAHCANSEGKSRGGWSIMENLIIQDAYENNLKHISLEIPINAFTCVTGCSGSGKSSLVFDTIYAESQRNFLEGVTGNIHGQRLMNKPRVGDIQNLRPALNVAQNYYNVNPRSTVGTVTEIAHYLRAIFSLYNSTPGHTVPENIFSANNPKSFCPNCTGLGMEYIVSEALMVPDPNKTLRDGGIVFFKGPAYGKQQKILEALCEYYHIDIAKKVGDLSQRELNLLLYASDDIKYKLSYKEGKKRRSYYVYLNGAITSINKLSKSGGVLSANQPFTQYMEYVPCHVCGGTKLRAAALQYKVGTLNYSEAAQLELSSLKQWLQELDLNKVIEEKRKVLEQMIKLIVRKIDALISLHVGYLCLNRAIPSLSGGERQRIRIANQLTCSLKGLIYIFDEPCRGLHYLDVQPIVDATKQLVARGNTVIAIEHNKQYLAAADALIELGPAGGPQGGYLVQSTSVPLPPVQGTWKEITTPHTYMTIKGINFRNIKGQNVRIPLECITCITGVSGSGKSSLSEVVERCFTHSLEKCFQSFSVCKPIKRVMRVNQEPIGKTPRSTVVSYLGIYDDIRKLFASTKDAKNAKYTASMFSMNVQGGRCEHCQGTGLQKIELNFLPSTYITCPECHGKRFTESILDIRYGGKNIYEVLNTPVEELVELFADKPKIYNILKSMIVLGLGYLCIGQMSMNLSGGEAQRIKLAKVLGNPSSGRNIYILDEPSNGLGDKDIDLLVDVILAMAKKGNTVLAIEHNIAVISKIADYIVDFGTFGGGKGGKVVAQGSPQAVFSNPKSSLYGLEQF